MTPAPGHHPDPLPELESTLHLLGSAEPRMGIEQRVLARLATAPAAPAGYRRYISLQFFSGRWAITAASAVIVTGAVVYGVERHRAASPVAQPFVVRAPFRASQPVAPAASVGVPEHPLTPTPDDQGELPARHNGTHRGIHRSFRAQHARTALPPGAVVPTRPHLLSAPQ